MECLTTNKICSNTNKKCKICKFDDCKNTLRVLEEEEEMRYKSEKQVFKEKLEREYPECLNCPFLEVKNLEEGKVKCFYRTKDRCILNCKFS